MKRIVRNRHLAPSPLEENKDILKNNEVETKEHKGKKNPKNELKTISEKIKQFKCKLCKKKFQVENRIKWNNTEKNCYSCILHINKDVIKNQKTNVEIKTNGKNSKKRKLSFAYAPIAKHRFMCLSISGYY